MLNRLLYLVGVIFILIGLAELAGLVAIGTLGAVGFLVVGAIILAVVYFVLDGPYTRRGGPRV